MDPLWTDLRWAASRVRRHPVTFLAIVFTLAAGLGAALGTFNSTYRALHRPLAYLDPGTLVIANDPVSATLISRYDWRPHPQAAETFADLAEYHLETDFLDLSGSERPVLMALVTPRFFHVLGVNLSFGDLGEAARSDGSMAWLPVIISHKLWRESLGGNPQIVGRKIALRRMYPYEFLVVGIAPADMAFPAGVDLWMPEHLTSFPIVQAAVPSSALTTTIARLRPGVSLAAAEAAIRSWSHTDQNWNWTGSSRLQSLREVLAGSYYRLGPLLWDLVLVFLALSVITVASIGWNENSRRRDELRLRLALGGTPLRVWQGQCIETAGVLLAVAPIAALLSWASERAITTYFAIPTGFNAHLAQFDLLIGLVVQVAGAAALVIPQWYVLSSVNPGPSKRGPSSRRGGAFVAGSALAVPVSISALVLALSGFLVRSAILTSTIDPGVRPQGAYVANVSLPDGKERFEVRPGDRNLTESERTRMRLLRASQYAHRVSFDLEQMCRRLLASRRVQSAGVISLAPYSGLPAVVNGVDISRGADRVNAREAQVHVLSMSPGAVEALGLQLLAGRGFTGDATDDMNTVIVNQTLARQFGSGFSALGQYVWTAWRHARVIGIVADVHEPDLLQPAVPTIYLPIQDYASPDVDLVVRTSGGSAPTSLLPAIRSAVRAVVPTGSVSRFGSLRDMVASAERPAKFAMVCLLALAGLGLLMTIGCAWALCAGEVQRRRAEIGVRLALGATPGRLVRSVVCRQAVWSAPSAAAGAICAWWISLGLGALLPGVLPGALSYIAGSALMLELTIVIVHGVTARGSLKKSPCELIASVDR